MQRRLAPLCLGLGLLAVLPAAASALEPTVVAAAVANPAALAADGASPLEAAELGWPALWPPAPAPQLGGNHVQTDAHQSASHSGASNATTSGDVAGTAEGHLRRTANTTGTADGEAWPGADSRSESLPSCTKACNRCFADHYQGCLAFCRVGCEDYCEVKLPRPDCEAKQEWVANVAHIFEAFDERARMCQATGLNGCPDQHVRDPSPPPFAPYIAIEESPELARNLPFLGRSPTEGGEANDATTGKEAPKERPQQLIFVGLRSTLARGRGRTTVQLAAKAA